jgi:hypothetical protein
MGALSKLVATVITYPNQVGHPEVQVSHHPRFVGDHATIPR